MGGIREHGVVVKRCRGCLRVALLYPSVYEAAVASLAYQLLYYMLNSMEGVVAERFILPSLEGVEEPLRSLETRAPLHSFDVILIPVSYELDALYAVDALLASGVDPRRPPGERPLIVYGGPVPSMNPAPFTRIGDVVVVGEAEPTIPLLVEPLMEGSGLEGLECRRGFLTSSCVETGERARRVYVENLDEAFHPVVEFRVPGSGEPWGEAYMVEVSRGCRWMCRFCMEAFFTLPWRVRSRRVIERLVAEGVEANNVSRVAFYSLSFFDHPDADRLLEMLEEMGLGVSIGSLRADTLNRERLEALARLGQRTVTIAPEVFSPRLSCLLGKRIPYETVEGLVVDSVRLGLKPKLYLMTGVPGETLRDVEDAAGRVRRLYRLSGGRLRATLNPLVPKPWTPLQYAPFIGEKGYLERLRVYRRVAGGVVEPLSYRWALAQAVIARGGFDVGDALYEAARRGVGLGVLLRALRRTPSYRRVLEGFEPGEELPWEALVDPGYPPAALRASWRAAERCISGDGG